MRCKGLWLRLYPTRQTLPAETAASKTSEYELMLAAALIADIEILFGISFIYFP